MSPERAHILLEREEKARQHTSWHEYTMNEYGLQGEVIYEKLADFFEEYQWEKPEAEETSASPG